MRGWGGGGRGGKKFVAEDDSDAVDALNEGAAAKNNEIMKKIAAPSERRGVCNERCWPLLRDLVDGMSIAKG